LAFTPTEEEEFLSGSSDRKSHRNSRDSNKKSRFLLRFCRSAKMKAPVGARPDGFALAPGFCLNENQPNSYPDF
jgi:hypothetical protein